MEHEITSESATPTSSTEVCTPKKKIRSQAKKRKRNENSDYEDEIIPENAQQLEMKLLMCAKKNNLDDTSVKKILKKVVTNDHVLALVKLKEEETNEADENIQLPKLTRSKVKELKKVNPNTPWDLEKMELTPIKHIPVKTRPEVKALIAQELPEDEDDEEYEPTHDDVMSDDDHTIDTCSDLDSQPRTPATPLSLPASSPKVVKDGPFKVPQDITTSSRRKLDMEEEATIALRTRSKLSLSSTSIEHIESSFVPPDEVPFTDVDDLWNQFLEECLNPQPQLSVSRTEDDDEADPEYNVAADPDANEDEELERNALRISKKELNDLVTELFNIMPDTIADEILSAGTTGGKPQAMQTSGKPPPDAMVSIPHWEGKQEPISDEEAVVQTAEIIHQQRFSIGKSEPGEINETEDTYVDSGANETNNNTTHENEQRKVADKSGDVNNDQNRQSKLKENINSSSEVEVVPVIPVVPMVLKMLDKGTETTIEIHVPVENNKPINMVYPEQVELIKQQLRMHVQLSVSNFLQLCVHPVLWQYAPIYKEYLITFNKLVNQNSSSVANVCNLRPALELVLSWEKSVTADTPENIAMVKFMQEECEKSQRRNNTHSICYGKFHPTLMETVANSNVFLYPALLPSMPYKPDHNRHTFYNRSEDELLVHGLGMFFDYIDANPDIYPQPKRRLHHNGRWGLFPCVELVSKHLMPGITPRMTYNHIRNARKVKGHPIAEFFRTRKVQPVKHWLLPFNPEMSLYQQPEYELPRIWLRYLAQNSTRFRKYLREIPKTLRRDTKIAHSIEVRVGTPVKPLKKKPLQSQFSQTSTYISANGRPIYHDESDESDVDNTGYDSEQETPEIIIRPQNDNQPDASQNSNAQKVPQIIIDCQFKDPNKAEQCNKETVNTFTVVQTKEGTMLMPVNDPESAYDKNSNDLFKDPSVGVITIKANTYWQKRRREQLQKVAGHCSCCVLIRDICKQRQKLITEYFTNKTQKTACPCKKARSIKHPKVTNKLRMLIQYYKNDEQNLVNDLKYKLKTLSEKTDKYNYNNILEAQVKRLEEEVTVAAFHTKFTLRMVASRNGGARIRVHKLLTKFDPEKHDPIRLMKDLEPALGVNLMDVYKELFEFLNPVQALKLKGFRDYFMSNCLKDLIKKIELEVNDAEQRIRLLSHIQKVIREKMLRPCGLCFLLMKGFKDVPSLAEYVFSLFPHKNPKSSSDEDEESTDSEENKDETSPVQDVQQLTQAATQNSVVEKINIVKEKQNTRFDSNSETTSEEDSFDEASETTLENNKKTTYSSISYRYNLRNSYCNKNETEIQSSQNIDQINENSNVKVETGMVTHDKNFDNTDMETEESALKPIVDKTNNNTLEESRLDKASTLDSTFTSEASQQLVYEHSEHSTSDTGSMMDTEVNDIEQGTERIKTEPSDAPLDPNEDSEIDTLELSISRTEVQQKVNNTTNLIVSITEEEIKTEPEEWTREEDKMILQALKYCSTPAQRKNENILDVLKNKGIIKLLAENMGHRSFHDVGERVVSLLKLLVLSEKK